MDTKRTPLPEDTAELIEMLMKVPPENYKAARRALRRLSVVLVQRDPSQENIEVLTG